MAGERILIVDDEAGVRSSLRGVLLDEGYKVEVAESGEQCLEAYERKPCDAVLLDVWLPKMDGLETLRELRQRGMDAAVVMMSGHGNIETAVRATKLGAFDFVEKPLSLEKTVLVLRNALKQRLLEARNRVLREQLQRRHTLIGKSSKIERLREEIRRASPTNGRVLIFGENGTGKELVARMIHGTSLRAEEAFVEMNCAAIPEELIESELFGHVKGSFTGAVHDKKGKFELADSGTLFLDEIADMSLRTQAKVLRVLQEQKFEPVGGASSVQVDVRVLTATNKDLQEEIRQGHFREDLYFRLAVIPIQVPSLRDRVSDVPLLAEHFAGEFAQEYGRRPKDFSAPALAALKAYRWPGNVRELKNVVERLVIMVPHDEIGISDLPAGLRGEDPARAGGNSGRPLSLREGKERFERELIQRTLEDNSWNITRAARVLKLERSHLHRKIKSYGINIPR
ncbi:MAG: sigma-54 dependent transcriptional regulator [Acidobacteriota bacterium]